MKLACDYPWRYGWKAAIENPYLENGPSSVTGEGPDGLKWVR
jgi:hypothetical protein